MSKSLEETREIAQKFLFSVSKKKNSATVIGLRGDLGSGKTAFVKEIATLLGIQEDITSPTFVIEKIYELKNKNFSHLIHIDAYRLEESSELVSLGWDDIIAETNNLIMIEWPELVKEIMPADAIYLDFMFIDEQTRQITIPDHA